MLLSEARTQIQNILDDDGTRWTSSEIDAALLVSLNECVQLYSAQGGTRLDEIATVAISAGSATLATVPLRITGLAMSIGRSSFPISIVPSNSIFQTYPWTGNISVKYIRTPTFPASDASHFIYGNAVSNWATFDRLIVCRAARKLAIKDREVIAALEAETNELLSFLLSSEIQSPVTSMPSGAIVQCPYVAQLVGTQILLGYRQ